MNINYYMDECDNCVKCLIIIYIIILYIKISISVFSREVLMLFE